MLDIVLNIVKEPSNGGLVVVVFLAFQNNFLAPEYKLLASPWRKVLFCEKVAPAIKLFLSTIFVLRRDAIGKILLSEICQWLPNRVNINAQ